MKDAKIDIVVERRRKSPSQEFDYLIKVDDITAFPK